METVLLVTTKKELFETLNEVLDNREKQNADKANPKSLTINQVALRLGRSHITIQRLIKQGAIKTTQGNRILEVELERFLNLK